MKTENNQLKTENEHLKRKNQELEKEINEITENVKKALLRKVIYGKNCQLLANYQNVNKLLTNCPQIVNKFSLFVLI